MLPSDPGVDADRLWDDLMSLAAITEPDRRGDRVYDDCFLLLFNASEQDLPFTVPPRRYGYKWATVLDTAMRLTEFVR